MVEALISALIEGLATMAFEGIDEEASLIKNVKKNVGILKTNLEAIQTVLEDAENKQLSDLGVKNWLDKLKDVSFDMDNVLDKWNTAILRSKIKEEAEENDVGDGRMKKVCFSVHSLFSCCTSSAMKQLHFWHVIAHEIKLLDERLEAIAREKDRYKLSTITAEQHLERPRTTSFIDETVIKGRDDENDILVSKLLCENSNDQGQELRIIPIVGMGGIGKTTLCQLAYNDKKVKAHFERRIWVCVSDPFDEMMITKAIIEAVEGNAPNLNEFESLLQHVVKCIEGKRFLLVLDDVWTMDKNKWDQLKQSLQCGANGSRVLVTTRKEEVAIMMEATSNMITLEMLSEENCWLIFKRVAFSERNENERQELEEIGRKIANKCKGLPLVAKVLGSLMRFKKTKTQWENVVHSEWWKFKDVAEIFTPFLLSYYDLSAKEKQCFSYCSIFPKDHRISRDELIELWISQNYFADESNSEDEGRECFDNLVMRSFFQNFEKLDFDGCITHCKMHDIVHDFVQFLTGKECIALEADYTRGNMLNPLPEQARHFTLVMGSNAEFPTINYSQMNKKKLRTLFIVSSYTSILKNSVDCSLFLHLTCLRSLRLFNCWVLELPTSIGKLIHLRYLDISNNYGLVELPGTFCNLCNLQTLRLINCYMLERLPEGIGNLVNLRNLCVRGCNNLEGFPKGIAKLAHLRNLDTLFVPENAEAFLNLGELKGFRNLRLRESLYIRKCRNLRSRDEAEKIHLKSISQDVAYLHLDFGRFRNINKDATFVDENAILEGLEPHHRNLVRLRVESFKGTNLSPRWMASLIHLREIEISICKNCKALPFLGNLPSLESISFSDMKSVKEVGLEFLGMTEREIDPLRSSANAMTLFPKLEYLKFADMEGWGRWVGQLNDDQILVMPRLSILEFLRCPTLRVLPEFLATAAPLLKQVSFYLCANWWNSRTGEEWDKISHAADIKVNGEFIRNDHVWIQADHVVSVCVSEEEDDDPFDKSSYGSPLH